MDKLEFEILVFASALESYKLQVARAKRIWERAEADYEESRNILSRMEQQLGQMRSQYLGRAA